VNLVSYYRENGFQVKHIPVRNDRRPALSDPELEQVWKAINGWKLVLIHWSAGIGVQLLRMSSES
jgi:hypothetical protein